MVEHIDDLEAIDRRLFPGSLTIRAIRDSRYHNTAYAIAELIDNSIEASAERVELLCMEQVQPTEHRDQPTISEIAVLDNGEGMDAVTLLNALKFGGGTRHETVRGIGKYGMGLPTASMSQCKRVDVWTWRDGLDSMLHSSIDADNIAGGDHNVPLPDRKPIPKQWKLVGNKEIWDSPSGTLVVWSNLDKVNWRRAGTVINHVSREIGRIHRHFIDADITRIRAVSFRDRRPNDPNHDLRIVANDPLYLMDKTSVPDPWSDNPMFKQWGEVKYYNLVVDGKEETIEVKYSIVKSEALRTEQVTQNPGGTEHGKHARHNIGVSVIREDREIILEDAFLREGGSADNPQNRWWGCEVHFRRNCDELFGVDHNKQMVTHFTQAAKALARDDRPNHVVLDEMELEEDDIIYRIVGDIRDQTRAMMREIRQMFSQRRDRIQINEDTTPEHKAVRTATDADRDALDAGREEPTKTDIDRKEIPSSEREAGLTEQFVDSGQPNHDAQQLARRLVREALSYNFNSDQLDGYQMFNVRSSHGVLHINLNADHPIYDLLRHIEDELDENIDEDDPVFQASVAIRLLLSSWARMEDQTEAKDERIKIQDIAMNWGRQVDKVIRHLRDRDD